MKTIVQTTLATCILLAAGCSKSSETNTATTVDGLKVKQTSNGEQHTFEVTEKSGEKTVLRASEKGMTLPADFPKDVPVHPKGVLQMHNNVGNTVQLGVMIPLGVAEVVQYYEAEFKQRGWTDCTATKMGEGAMIGPNKDGRSTMVMISPQNPTTTFVQMTLSPKGG